MTLPHRTAPTHVHPLVRQLFTAMGRKGLSLTSVAKRAGIRRKTISDWRREATPSTANLIACLNAVGLDLAVVPLKERK